MDFSPCDPGAPQRPGGRRTRLVCRLVAALAATVLLVPALPATTHAAANKVHPKLTRTAPGGDLVDVLVTLDPGADWSAIVRIVGAKFIKHWDLSATVRLQVPSDKLDDLAQIPGVRWVTPNAKVVATGVTTVSNTFASTVQAPALWSLGLQGDGVTVAVLDTGIATNRDLPPALSQYVDSFPDGVDRMGHGTAVAGLIVGASPNGSFRGIAPRARLLSVKVLGDDGTGSLADVLNGLEWVNENRRQYNIKVVNLSLTAGVVDSYKKNPINAAVEALWFNGVVVVAAAGNRGVADMAVATAPGNDPFAITVGSTNDHGTADISDDNLAAFSSRGTTLDGVAKPDVTAPGDHVVTTLAPNSVVAANATTWFVGGDLVQMSGTSLSAPMVSGAVALLLQARPDLTPNQVKWLLAASARRYPGQPDSAGELNLTGAVALARSLTTVPAANQGVEPADGVLGTPEGALVDQVYWDQVYWDQVYWDQVYWDQVYWDQ